MLSTLSNDTKKQKQKQIQPTIDLIQRCGELRVPSKQELTVVGQMRKRQRPHVLVGKTLRNLRDVRSDISKILAQETGKYGGGIFRERSLVARDSLKHISVWLSLWGQRLISIRSAYPVRADRSALLRLVIEFSAAPPSRESDTIIV